MPAFEVEMSLVKQPDRLQSAHFFTVLIYLFCEQVLTLQLRMLCQASNNLLYLCDMDIAHYYL